MTFELNLKSISEELLKAEEELEQALIEVLPLEKEYTTAYNKGLVANSGLATQAMREAETMEALKTDGVWDKYQDAKLKAKLAYSRRDTLMEISRNIRSYAFES